jgi:hypothetical protein
MLQRLNSGWEFAAGRFFNEFSLPNPTAEHFRIRRPPALDGNLTHTDRVKRRIDAFSARVVARRRRN